LRVLCAPGTPRGLIGDRRDTRTIQVELIDTARQWQVVFIEGNAGWGRCTVGGAGFGGRVRIDIFLVGIDRNVCPGLCL
jgi:hypothetical protein